MAFNDNTAIWMATNYSDFNFSDCSLAANWGAILYTTFDFPMNETENLLMNGLQDFWYTNQIPQPSQMDLLSWFMNVTSSGQGPSYDLLQAMMQYTTLDCLAEFCKKLPWQGNSDLTGRGMIFSYCFQAALVTFYFFALLVSNYNLVRPGQSRRNLTYNIVNAFRESARTFLDTTLVFSGAVLVATIYTLSVSVYRSNKHPDKPMTMSGPVANMFVALFSMFPCMVLHALASRFLRPGRTRKLVWIFQGILISASVTLYHVYRYNPLEDEGNWLSWDLKADIDNQYQWEVFCLDKQEMVRTNRVIIGFSGLVVLIALFYILFIWNLFRIPVFNPERNKTSRRLHDVWWLIAAVIPFLGMWACLAFFLDLRHKLYQNAGATNKDREWTFGQVLATGTWVPVLADFFHILFQEPEEALNRKLTDRYRVVKTSTRDGDMYPDDTGYIFHSL